MSDGRRLWHVEDGPKSQEQLALPLPTSKGTGSLCTIEAVIYQNIAAATHPSRCNHSKALSTIFKQLRFIFCLQPDSQLFKHCWNTCGFWTVLFGRMEGHYEQLRFESFCEMQPACSPLWSLSHQHYHSSVAFMFYFNCVKWVVLSLPSDRNCVRKQVG